MEQIIRNGMLLVYLLMAAAMDIRTKKVSLRAAIIFAAAGIIVEMLWRQLDIGVWLAGILPGLFFMMLAWITREAVGYGDGAVLLVCGVFLGLWDCLRVLLLGLFLSFPFSLFCVVCCRAGRKKEIPFVPFLMAGYCFRILMGI